MDIQQDAAHNVPDVILHNGFARRASAAFRRSEADPNAEKPSTIWRREARPLGLSETVTEVTVTSVTFTEVTVTEISLITVTDITITEVTLIVPTDITVTVVSVSEVTVTAVVEVTVTVIL